MKIRIVTGILCGVFFALWAETTSAVDQASHLRGLETNNGFVKISEGGFGDSANSYSWSVLPFKGKLYVGTNRHHLHSMYEALTFMPGSPINPNMMPANLWPDAPPSTTWFSPDWAQAFQGEIWRYDEQEKWERVHQSGVIQLSNSSMAPVAYGYRALAEFNGYLYACGIGTWMPPANNNSILRSASGNPGTWEDVSGIIKGTTNIRAITTWKGKLYVAASVSDGMIPGAGPGAVVFESADPGTKIWKPLNMPGFGGNNSEIYYLAVFNNQLYASTVNLVTGFELWKTDGTLDPLNQGMYIWKPVIRNGFGDTWNQYGMTMAVYQNYLYLGTAVGIGMVMKDNKPVGTRAIEIIRVDKNDKAELIVGASKASDPIEGGPTRRVPRSGLGAGFGNPFNVYAWNMNVYKNCLYVGTFDMSVFAFGMLEKNPELFHMFMTYFAPSDLNFPPEIVDAIINSRLTPQVLELLNTYFGGGDLWKSCNGINWMPVTLNGFGNPLNYGIREVIPLKENGKDVGLAIGTANPFTGRDNGGCEVWLQGKLPKYGPLIKVVK